MYLSYFDNFKLLDMFKIMSLIFGLFTQVSNSGPYGILVFCYYHIAFIVVVYKIKT